MVNAIVVMFPSAIRVKRGKKGKRPKDPIEPTRGRKAAVDCIVPDNRQIGDEHARNDAKQDFGSTIGCDHRARCTAQVSPGGNQKNRKRQQSLAAHISREHRLIELPGVVIPCTQTHAPTDPKLRLMKP